MFFVHTSFVKGKNTVTVLHKVGNEPFEFYNK